MGALGGGGGGGGGGAAPAGPCAQNTPAINIIDNARIMMLPGNVGGGMMAQKFSEKSSDLSEVLAQKDSITDDEELLSQLSSLVELDTEEMLGQFHEATGLDKEQLLAQLRATDAKTLLT